MNAEPADLPFEQAKNIEYLGLLKAWLEKPAEYGITRGRQWVAPTPHIAGKSYELMHPLVGRVGLSDPDELMGTNFYIGSRHIEEGDLRVFSWAAPISRLFFEIDREDALDEVCVVVRRTFTHRADAIADLDDEWLRSVEVSPFAPRALVVPSPSGPRAQSRAVSRRDGLQPAEPVAQPLARPDAAAPAEVDPLLQTMRAKDAVLRRIKAPRADRLSSVLATLQPDQYALVARAADESLIIQGHPGTGKSIVAAYRATFLTSERDKRGPRVRRLLLVGPSAEYVKHVEGLVRPLDLDGRVHVTDLEELLDSTTGLKTRWSGGIGGEHDDVDAAARGLADSAARMLASAHEFKQGPTAPMENIKAVYELVRANGRAGQSLARDSDRIAWMQKLPPFDRVSRLRRYLPLLAQCRVAYKSVPDADKFDHIVVDESQDVSPIEWNVLEHYMARGGQWTLVGDMNQRRSDSSYGTWAELADHLGIGDGDSPFDVSVMRRGYRSTGPILRFAEKLLPGDQRGNQSIQSDGPPVRVERASRPEELVSRAIRIAEDYITTYAEGTVAIITVDPAAIIQQLGKGGWRRENDMHNWTRGSRRIKVYVPEDARGIEFDAVVVVEPVMFPENLGRSGQLYTSLTRANRELAVVWSLGLPDPLRKAARS
jgi:DNA helicase II / ATP-dependent DNA helicase PcrA